MEVEGAKGECNFGQQEIGFLYAEAMETADNHAVYKTACKEIASQHGKSVTFLAKYNEREGNSCHIHLSLRGTDGELVFWDKEAGEPDPALRPVHRRRPRHGRRLHAAVRAEHQLLQAVRERVVRADHHRVGARQPHLRRPPGRARVPARGWRTGSPGADVNPYLALAAMLAGGLHGIENELELEDELSGNAYTSGRPQVPSTMAAAREVFATSQVAREALGDEVVDHYVNMADVELAAFREVVTDWELRRGFERL